MERSTHSELELLINDAYATRSARSITALSQKARSLEEQIHKLHNDLGRESMRCEKAEGRVAQLEKQIARRDDPQFEYDYRMAGVPDE